MSAKAWLRVGPQCVAFLVLFLIFRDQYPFVLWSPQAESGVVRALAVVYNALLVLSCASFFVLIVLQARALRRPGCVPGRTFTLLNVAYLFLAVLTWFLHVFGFELETRHTLAFALLLMPVVMTSTGLRSMGRGRGGPRARQDDARARGGALGETALSHEARGESPVGLARAVPTSTDRRPRVGPSRSQPVQTVLINLIAVLCLVNLVEIGTRTFTSVKRVPIHDYGQRYDFVLAPYVMFAEPGQGFGGTLNRQGFQGPPFPLPREAGEIRVAVLGGSAAWSGGEKKSIAAFLELALEDRWARDGRALRVANFGRQSYVSMQELILLERDVLPLDCDLIVVYDGFNDLWVPKHEGRVGAPLLYDALKRRSERSSIFRRDMLLQVLASRSTFAAYLQNRSAANRGHIMETPIDVTACLEEFERNHRQMALLARGYGQRLAFVTQPFVGTKRVLTAKEASALPADLLARTKGYYEDLAARSSKVARETGSEYVDVLKVFDDRTDDIYTDAVHVDVDKGNPLIARTIADEILARNLLPAVRDHHTQLAAGSASCRGKVVTDPRSSCEPYAAAPPSPSPTAHRRPGRR